MSFGACVVVLQPIIVASKISGIFETVKRCHRLSPIVFHVWPLKEDSAVDKKHVEKRLHLSIHLPEFFMGFYKGTSRSARFISLAYLPFVTLFVTMQRDGRHLCLFGFHILLPQTPADLGNCQWNFPG